MKLDLENSGLTGKIRLIILGEGDIDVKLFACVVTDDLLLKAGNECART